MSSQAYEPVRKLVGLHAVESFDCRQSALNQFLQRIALVNQKSNSAQTYVCCHSGSVVGFYSLVVGSVEPPNAPPRVTKGIPQYPAPVMMLARLAVDLQHQGAGLGKALLKDALLRTAQAADFAGIRALLVRLIEELFELVAMLPWWAGVLTAICLYFGLHIYASQPIAPMTTATQISDSIFRAAFAQVAGVVQYVLPLICLFAAAASAWKASKRKSLLQGVTSSKSAASLEAMTWQEFEQLVGEAFRLKGYQVTELGGARPDGGIDLLLTKGSEITLVQCKQWKAFKVGVDVVRSLYGVMAAKGAANGIVVTSGKFTADAQEFALGRNVKLLAGEELFGMLKSAKAEITRQEATQAKTVAAGPACPACGSAMVRRQGKRGTNAGNYFWGCATFPKCRGTASS